MAENPNTRKKQGPPKPGDRKPGRTEQTKQHLPDADRDPNKDPLSGDDEDMDDENKVTERHPAQGRNEPNK